MSKYHNKRALFRQSTKRLIRKSLVVKWTQFFINGEKQSGDVAELISSPPIREDPKAAKVLFPA